MQQRQSEDGQYRAEGCHLYVRTPGQFPGDVSYVHCYQNPRAKSLAALIREYEQMQEEDGDLI